jgi:hypothetical protein
VFLAFFNLRTALKQSEDLRFVLGTPIENAARALLAAVLVDEGSQPEAKEVALSTERDRHSLSRRSIGFGY